VAARRSPALAIFVSLAILGLLVMIGGFFAGIAFGGSVGVVLLVLGAAGALISLAKNKSR
jgi:hypothetical protein